MLEYLNTVVKSEEEFNPLKIPNEFFCPISKEIMNDPVVNEKGFSYERTHIADHYKKNRTDPKTGDELTTIDFYTNFNL